MLSKFEIILECEKDFINRNLGSLFHGVLMERLPSDYAEILHENNLKPFSQSISPCKEGLKWSVNCLNAECSKYIYDALMNNTDTIELKHKNKILNILSSSVSSISYKQLIDNTYFSAPSDFIKVYFNTPTSFKIDGKYIIYPDMASIYKNLIHKFDAFSNEFALFDEDMLESLITNSVVTSYNLKSSSYSLESVKIPSFTGMITLKIHSSPQLRNLAKLLFGFGEYSGIGIKTALGMGAIRTEEVNRFEKR